MKKILFTHGSLMDSAIKSVARLGTVLTLAFLWLAAPASSQAQYVVTNTADSGSGTLREALGFANGQSGASTIVVPAGHYTLSSGSLNVTADVTIQGAGARSVILDGNGGQTVIYVGPSANAFLTGVTVTGGYNTVFTGAGLQVDGSVTLSNVTVSGNNAEFGGGMRLTSIDASATVIGCTFSGNSGFGSAIESQQGSVTIINSTFTGNEGGENGDGGTIRLSNAGDVVLYNSTVVSNADVGIVVGGGSAGADILSSIVAINSGGDLEQDDPGMINDLGNNLISVTPMVGALTNNGGPTDTLALLPGSPAIDAGTNFLALATDQRGPGFARVIGSAADIGAVEFSSYSLATNALVEGAAAGTDSIALTVAPTNAPWTAIANASWLHLDVESGDGSTNVIFSFDANPGAVRVGTLTIGGLTLTITQEGSLFEVITNADSGPGSLREALALANAQSVTSTIMVPAGHYVLSSGSLNLLGDVIIQGAGARSVTLDGNGGQTVIYVGPSANAFLTGVTVTGGYNTVFTGAGLQVDGSVTLSNVTVSGNNAEFGGGMRLTSIDASATVIGCTFSGNSGFGSAIESQQGSVTIINSTFTGNEGGENGDGGTIRLSNAGDVVLYNSTVVSNADVGIVVGGGSAGADILSSIVAINSGGDLEQDDPGMINDLGNNLISVNPMVGALTNNGGPTDTMALLPGSPAIDAGANPDNLATDQRGPGFSRVVGSASDIGAYEYAAQQTGAGPNLMGFQWLGNGTVRLSFTNSASATFSVLSTTNLSLPLGNWTVAGSATNMGAGVFQFTSQPTTNDPQRFYSVRSP